MTREKWGHFPKKWGRGPIFKGSWRLRVEVFSRKQDPWQTNGEVAPTMPRTRRFFFCVKSFSSGPTRDTLGVSLFMGTRQNGLVFPLVSLQDHRKGGTLKKDTPAPPPPPPNSQFFKDSEYLGLCFSSPGLWVGRDRTFRISGSSLNVFFILLRCGIIKNSVKGYSATLHFVCE